MKGRGWLVTSFTFAGTEFEFIGTEDFLHQVVLQGYHKCPQGQAETVWAESLNIKLCLLVYSNTSLPLLFIPFSAEPPSVFVATENMRYFLRLGRTGADKLSGHYRS